MCAGACCCIPGEKFSPSAIEKARQDLAAIGVFSVVRIEPAKQLDAQGRLPLTVSVTERPLHSVDAGIGYSTDLGVNFNLGWHDRNLFGNAEQLNLTAMMQLGGDAITKPGYQFGAQFIKPDFLRRDQSLEIDLNAVDQSLQAYDQNALQEKIAINRKLSQYWTASVGVSGEQEEITQEGEKRHYNLIGLPLSLKYDSSNSLLDPTKGIRATFSATPTEALGTGSTSFVILQAAGSTYLDLTGNGRSVLALRGLVGEVPGVGTFALAAGPAVLCRRQRDGARLSLPVGRGRNSPTATRPAGPRSTPATVEFRQRILGNYGVGGVRRCGAGEHQRRAVQRATGSVGAGVGRALLHADRADPAGRRGAAGPAARRGRVRVVYRDRAGVLKEPLPRYAQERACPRALDPGVETRSGEGEGDRVGTQQRRAATKGSVPTRSPSPSAQGRLDLSRSRGRGFHFGWSASHAAAARSAPEGSGISGRRIHAMVSSIGVIRSWSRISRW